MKKWNRIIPVLLTGSLFLGGCSMDSKVQVVVPKEQKERSLSVAENEDSLSEQVQAPERYQCDSTDNGIHILANARIMVPDVEGIRLKKVRSKKFDEEDMDLLTETVLQGEPVYGARELDFSMENELPETELAYDQEAVKDGTAEASGAASYAAETEEAFFIDSYREALEVMQEMLGGERPYAGYKMEEIRDWSLELGWASSDETERRRLWTLASFCNDLAWGDMSWEKGELREMADEEWLGGMVFLGEDIGLLQMENVSVDMNWINVALIKNLVSISEEDREELLTIHGMEKLDYDNTLLTDTEIRSASEELRLKLGGGDLELASIEERQLVYYYPMDSGVSQIESGVCFVYNRVVDGVSMNYTGQKNGYYSISDEGDLVQWPDEEIYAVYDEDGLVGFQWTNPIEIEDWQEEYAFLLPFSEIRDIFEEMTFSDYTEKRRDFTGTWTVNIQEVRLGYVPVANKEAYQTETNTVTIDGDRFYTGILVPAWDFIGTVEGDMAEWMGVRSGSRISFMTINAMDGSIIEKEN